MNPRLGAHACIFEPHGQAAFYSHTLSDPGPSPLHLYTHVIITMRSSVRS
jgi:hypothetical protein